MKPLKIMTTFMLAAMLATIISCSSTAHKEHTSASKNESAGEYLDDSVITTRVKTAIFNEATLKSTEINVETYKGVVQLSGFVNSQADINMAVEVARSVAGVSTVKNNMQLKTK